MIYPELTFLVGKGKSSMKISTRLSLKSSTRLSWTDLIYIFLSLAKKCFAIVVLPEFDCPYKKTPLFFSNYGYSFGVIDFIVSFPAEKVLAFETNKGCWSTSVGKSISWPA